jgi:hypothetical protein
MRSLSTAFLEAINAQETGVVPITLLTITHPDLEEPILVCNNPTTRLSDDPLLYGTISRGDTYLYIPFDPLLPDETDRAPEAKITIANIGRDLVTLIRSVVSPPSIVMEIVLSTDLDTVEITFAELLVANSVNTAKNVDLELTIDNLGQEPFPAMRFTPSQFPGLFALV